jgi:membrane-associated phospholipid phosphatase
MPAIGGLMRDAPRDLVRQCLHLWPTKLWLGTLLTVLFCAGYFAIQHHPLRPVTTLPPSFIDRAISFSSGWTWVYQSMYLMLPFAWLARTRGDLAQYAIGLALVAVGGFAFFLIWPVAGPRPGGIATIQGTAYALLVRYDAPTNSFPSLHIALAVYTACFALSMIDATRARRPLAIVLTLWIALIAYATLATKQHYAIDLTPGALLGWLAHRASAQVYSRRQTAMPSQAPATPPHLVERSAA